ncbi:MAG: NADH-quinone oxidoreductase subunit J [Candidatus Nezhaarchaeota archaeon]|nr:NADH-quinone oxidoreductase subunit J [Candidatus Nezhaarchaeota archaeon]MCX8142229.1 NADH-quinone oxidoreductase subunit J [Candidatus Nezhaarchaeota archaeon]MDW8050798.1 NADH-quinone oxidoreductase subunit J [Nitrososphaerota archaeon]
MWDVAIIFLAILTAIFAVEAKDLVKSVIAFSAMSVFVATLYYVMGAFYASIFQLLIYAGAVTVLFAVTVHMIRRRRTA